MSQPSVKLLGKPDTMDTNPFNPLAEKIRIAVLAEVGKPEHWPLFDGLIRQAIKDARFQGIEQMTANMEELHKQASHVATVAAYKALWDVFTVRARQARDKMTGRQQRW